MVIELPEFILIRPPGPVGHPFQPPNCPVEHNLLAQQIAPPFATVIEAPLAIVKRL